MFYKIMMSACVSLFVFNGMAITMEGPSVDSSPLRGGFKAAKEMFGLQTTGISPRQYGIPVNVRTGISEEIFGKQLTPLPPMDLSNYDEIITNTGATIPQVLAAFPPHKWKKIFPHLEEEIQFNAHLSNEEAFNDKDAKRKFKNWREEKYASEFLMRMLAASNFLPPLFVKECPASLIMICGFSQEDTNFEKAIKFLKLGIKLTDVPQLERVKALSLSAEAFHLAAVNFESVLPQVLGNLSEGVDPISILDCYVSILQCHTWAAIRYPDIGATRENIKNANRIFKHGFKLLREIERNPEFTNELREGLAPFKKKLLQWAETYYMSARSQAPISNL